MKAIRLAAVAAITGTILAGGVNAFAEEVGHATTDNSVNFKAPDGDAGETPVDPPGPDPIDPVDPVDPEQGGKGPLRLVYVPKKFDFGEQVISVDDQSIPMIAEEYSTDGGEGTMNSYSFAQVIDERGTNAGWSLSVDLSDFSTEDDAIIKGAALTFVDGEVDYNTDGGEAPSTPKGEQVVAAGGDTVALLSATEGQGAGKASVMWGDEDIKETGMNENIRLIIPGNANKNAAAYQADLTWTLSSTVSADGPAL